MCVCVCVCVFSFLCIIIILFLNHVICLAGSTSLDSLMTTLITTVEQHNFIIQREMQEEVRTTDQIHDSCGITFARIMTSKLVNFAEGRQAAENDSVNLKIVIP